MNRDAIHIDYETIDGNVVHDHNKYKSYKEAIMTLLKQFDNVNEEFVIKKIIIQPWSNVHEERANINKKKRRKIS